MPKPRILVALATFNEVENLPGLVDAIHGSLPDADVLVVDDNSPDGTGRWCDERAASDSRLACLHRAGKLGLGSATLAAIRYAIEHEYTLVVTMDADWSHDPVHLPELVAATDHADVAIGSRYVAGGAIEGWPWYRRTLSRWINGLSRQILDLPICDTSGAFRAYRVAKLHEIRLDEIQSTGYAYLEEILWHLTRADATFAEVPITFRERRAGRSKISVQEAAGKLRTLWRLRGASRPKKIDARDGSTYPDTWGANDKRSLPFATLSGTLTRANPLMAVTIYEIAKRAGVSSSTVARVLRGDDRNSYRRSAETAERIRQIAREMGYRPNLRARAFSRGRTRGIGLLYTDDAWIFEGVNTEVVNSLVRRLQQDGHHLVFCPIDGRGAWQEIVLGGQIDGGVVFQPMPKDVSTALHERHLPLVLLGDNSDPSLPQVVVDDVAGAYAAAKHLIGLGHRRIMMFVHETIKPHCSVQDRLAGYRSAMGEAGLETRELVRKSDGDAVDALVRGDDRPTAVICYSDLESTLLVQALWQKGVAVPADVSVVGFNDVFATRYMTPPLTTVGFDAAKIGELGADLLLKNINAKDGDIAATVLTVKPMLIVRGSTGPAPNHLSAESTRRNS